MDLELREKVVLITGGSDGLGLALASRLVGEGARVAVCSRDDERLRVAQEQLGTDALCYRADVTKEGELDGFVEAALARFGRLDGVVNNAGRSDAVSIATSNDQQWRDDYELKVIAALHLSRATIEPLAASRGAVLNVLAIRARTPGSGSTPTSASRLAGLALTKALAGEVAPRGVRVNAILIGLVESGQWVRRAAAAGLSAEEFYQKMVTDNEIPLGRVGRAEEFADLAAFLLSSRASYITGAAVSLDGGLSPVI
ncbi:MAG TPA: SDR family oxidoreductase [Acidimicrobiales bacterium]|jgi:NAD(P)-dependent dehydrogenase (short-subunit alcohol dehydrogenase family)